jgi:hypothetical protein
MAKHTGRGENILASNEVRQNPLRGPGFFFFGGSVGVLYFCCSHEILTLFSVNSKWVPQVPNLIHNIFPTAPHSTSIALSSTLVTYITSPEEEITTDLFWDCLNIDYLST